MLVLEPATQPTSPLIAIIGVITGLIGLATAAVTNWDKLFAKNKTIQATVVGYTPTEDFETELRYYFEVSGVRKMLEATQEATLQNEKAALLSQDPQEAENIIKYVDAVEKESIRFDDVVKALLPVYQKHFTLSEIQELNKFYSTAPMRGMVSKLPLVALDIAPIQVKLVNDYFARLRDRLDSKAAHGAGA